MSNEKENNFDTGEFIFHHAISELSYIKKSIKIIDKNLIITIQDLNTEYENEFKEQYENNSYGLNTEEFSKFMMPKINDSSSDILSSINESILIKTYSIFEKAIILFAYEMQKYYECKIPPHFNKNKNTYTDIISAKEYILNLSEFDLSKLETWNAIVNIRDVRNRLSHGNTLLKINEQRVKEINTEFTKYFNESNIPLLISRKDELNKFRINQDINVLYIIRTLIAKTIILLDMYYTNMRVNDNKFELDSYLYGESATEEVFNILKKEL